MDDWSLLCTSTLFRLFWPPNLGRNLKAEAQSRHQTDEVLVRVWFCRSLLWLLVLIGIDGDWVWRNNLFLECSCCCSTTFTLKLGMHNIIQHHSTYKIISFYMILHDSTSPPPETEGNAALGEARFLGNIPWFQLASGQRGTSSGLACGVWRSANLNLRAKRLRFQWS